MSGYVNSDGSSNTYTTIKNYLTEVEEIINSSGLFKNNSKQVINQVNSINNIVDQFNSAIVSSLKRDLIDILNNSVNWSELQQRLTNDIQTKPSPINYKFETFNFKTDKLNNINDEIITNMSLLISDIEIDKDNVKTSMRKHKKAIRQYNDYKNEFISESNNFINEVKMCENKAIECRNKNLNIMYNNIETLYKIHAIYAYNLLHKRKNLADTIIYKNNKNNNIVIHLDRSQSKFIKNAIIKMLEIE